MATIKLMHGSDHVIPKPKTGLGSPNNDYGRGFYCTRDNEMACEWACKKNTDGFVNVYSFDDKGLKTLNLLSKEYSVLNWIAILLQHRTFDLSSEMAANARKLLIENYAIDLSAFDVVIGYRADDSYFKYAESFVANALPLRTLKKALTLGKLGEQTVVVSEKGFSRLKFVESRAAAKEDYYPRFAARDTAAREAFRTETARDKSYLNDIFILDILREGMKKDDPRLQ